MCPRNSAIQRTPGLAWQTLPNVSRDPTHQPNRAQSALSIIQIVSKEQCMATTTSREPGSGALPLARYFGLDRYKVTVGSEMMAGLTTFLVMAYIAFVNPGILSSVPDKTGFRLDFAATVTATCWVAAFLCILMGVFAKRPFAMAPGMGLNAV